MTIRMDNRKENLILQLSVVLCIAVFIGSILIHMLPLDIRSAFRTMHTAVTALCFFWLSVVYRQREKKFSLFVLLYFLWLVISRLVYGDFQQSILGELCCAAEMYVAFIAGCAFSADEQKKLLKWFTFVIAGFFTLWAACGLAVILTDVVEISLIDETIHLSDELQDTGVLRFLEFFSVHRNESAAWFMITLWLIVVQIIESKNKIWKVILAIDGMFMYLMIALQHCRSVYVVTAVGSGMLVYLVLMEQKWNTKLYVRISAAVFAALLGTTLVYKGYSLCNRIPVNESSVITSSANAVSLAQSAGDAAAQAPEDIAFVSLEAGNSSSEVENLPEESPPVDIQQDVAASNDRLPDNRNFWEDLHTLTMRTEVWSAVINTMKNRHEFLLWGQPEGDISINLQRYGGMARPISHAHNMFAQVLSLAGLPGLILLLAFTVCVVWNAIRCFLGSGMFAGRLLTIPLACLLVYGIMEPLCSGHIEFTSVCFMMIAGIVVHDQNA